MSSIEEKVIAEIRQRAKKGEAKYGTTMDRNDLSFVEWVQHLKEELMDAVVYAQKILEYSLDAHPNENIRDVAKAANEYVDYEALDTQSNTLYIEEE